MDATGIVTQAFMCWVIGISALLASLVITSNDMDKTFYRFGPHDNLRIMGMKVDTNAKYAGVVLYSFVNSMFRAVHTNYLHPWMVNNVQDEQRSKAHLSTVSVYQLTVVLVVYNWTDWLLYINILLAQIDMMLIEVAADLFVSCLLTSYYLRTPRPDLSTAIRSLRVAPIAALRVQMPDTEKGSRRRDKVASGCGYELVMMTSPKMGEATPAALEEGI